MAKRQNLIAAKLNWFTVCTLLYRGQSMKIFIYLLLIHLFITCKGLNLMVGWPTSKRGLLRKFNCTLKKMGFFLQNIFILCVTFKNIHVVLNDYNIKVLKVRHKTKMFWRKNPSFLRYNLSLIFGWSANQLLRLHANKLLKVRVNTY